jgi:Fe-S cluster assembly iron-binding protein IscA
MIRISFGGFGWGGPRLQLTLDELKNQEDVLEESNGIRVVYNSSIEAYVRNSVVDYSKSWFRRGFFITGGGVSSC